MSLPRHLAAALTLITSASLLAITTVAQSPVDLSTWTAESYQAVSGFPAGAWTVAGTGLSVTQSNNGQPTFFYSDFGLLNLSVEGQFTVTGSDDDYAGFALGYQPGDVTNPNADYLLLDWKRLTQNFNFGAPSCTAGSVAARGLALSRVQGIPTADELWGHVNLDTAPCSTANDSVTELQRGLTLNDTGWVKDQTYSFRIDYTPNRVSVYVDNVLQIDMLGNFGAGRLAFYNFSQAGVVYNAFTSTCIASWSNYGSGFPGTNGVPALTASAAPVLGTTIDVLMTSASPIPEVGLLVLGWQAINVPTPLGGTLLTTLDVTNALVLPVAPTMATFTLPIPIAPQFCGATVQAQLVHFDSGAAQGFAFSRGLQLALGN